MEDADQQSVDRHVGFAAEGDVAVQDEELPSEDRAEHNVRQAAAFDKAAVYFAQEEATPENVVPLLRRIAAAAVRPPAPRSAGAEAGGGGGPPGLVVDVGCGSGALAPYLLEGGLPAESYLGVDLSPNMLAACRARVAAIAGGEAEAGAGGGCGGARFWRGDITDLQKAQALGPAAASLAPGSAALHRLGAGSVVFNAVFGNVYDQRAALAAAADLLCEGGRVVLSHPLGRAFLDRLKAADPIRVPHSLPSEEDLGPLLAGLPLALEIAEGASGEPDGSLYLVSLRKTAFQLLPEPFLARGPVAEGYGRGSRKLGFPTANLPSSTFAERLASVDAAVYSGWAALGGEVFAAVVNVGLAPTFEGAEHGEKILEAHLLDFPADRGDFYGQELTLLLAARHRPELKFEGIQSLQQAIAKDASDARQALLSEPALRRLRSHPALAGGAEAWLRRPLEAWLAECRA